MILALFTALDGPGGIQRVGRHVAATLTAESRTRGWTCSVLALNDQLPDQEFEVGGITFRARGFGARRVPFIMAAVMSTHRASVCYLGHPSLSPIGLGLRAIRPDLAYWVALYGVESWRRLPALVRLGLRASAGMVAISRYTAQRAVTAQGLCQRKIAVVPLAVDPAIRALSTTGADGADEGKRERTLLTICRLASVERYKGVDTVIRAMPAILTAIPTVRYVVVGEGDDRPRLEAIARECGVADHVRFVAHRTEEELARHYRECDVFVMPSSSEGFGLVYVEAMLFAKPVIACLEAATPEIVVDGLTGFLVNYGDTRAIADRVTLLLVKRELCRSMGQAGRLRATECFGFEQFRQRMTNALWRSDQEGRAQSGRLPTV